MTAPRGVTPYSIREVLGKDLLSDEEILWAGQPDPNIVFAKADAFLVPFSLLWGGFAFFWEGWVIASLLSGEDRSGNGGSLYMFVVFGAFFVVIGLYFMFGRFIYKRLRKQNTCYAVTNKRIISLTNLFGRHFNSAFIDQIPSIQKSVNSAGTGGISFGNDAWWLTQYENTGLDFFAMSKTDSRPSFYDIHEVDTVYDVVNTARTAALARSKP